MAKDIPHPINTLESIKKILNGVNESNVVNNAPWVQVPSYYGMSVPGIDENKLDFLGAKSGVVLVTFLNTETAEIKCFVAKFLDIPDDLRNKIY